MQRTWNESSLRRSLPRRSRRRSRRLCSSAEVAFDSSGPESVTRYVLFVLFAAATVIVVVAPGALLLRTRPCRNLSGCYSLQRDLLASIDNRVPPCDDFYWHVCGGWDRQYATTRGQTASWYEEVFMDVFLWKIMQRIVPKTPVKTLDKAASMLLHCVKDSGNHGGEALRHFLQEVGLSWPHRSPATREQLLDSLVVLSLDIGMPTLLKFVVGRHLSRPTENSLYMSLDRRYELWSQDIDRLHGRGALSRFLRRGAEVIGGLGGSYSTMIEDVLTTHEDLWSFVQARAHLSIPVSANVVPVMQQSSKFVSLTSWPQALLHLFSRKDPNERKCALYFRRRIDVYETTHIKKQCNANESDSHD
ncbi:neprilysin-1-like [Dermacentor variabilis]|uniref:neprilysin-1-like n=1 Tax=Dermacentor variabilis TaxID=34621 RepID=UPI003F5BF489